MSEIESGIRELFGKFSKQIPGGDGVKNLLVVLCAVIGGYLAYKWLKDNLSSLLKG